MGVADSMLRVFKDGAGDAQRAHALMKIAVALAFARRLRDEGRRLELDSRGGLMIDPPLNSDRQRRHASLGPVLERLLSPQWRHWAAYVDGASLLLERLAAAGARPREAEGELVADLPDDDAQLRMTMAFYSSAAVKLLRAQAIVRVEQERTSLPGWRRALAWCQLSAKRRAARRSHVEREATVRR